MLNTSEKNILKFIRYAPIIFIILSSFLITYSFIQESEKKLQTDIKNLENEYFQSQKDLVRNEVQRVYNYINYQKETSEQNLKNELKQRIYEAHSIATNIYNENKEKTKAEVLKLIQDALRSIRFNEGRGYYFMHNHKGFNILYPLDRKLENIDYSNLQDINGYYFVKKIMSTIKNKTENFDTYYWSKPTNEGKRIYKKIAFYKYFEPLNISIGTGEYIRDYEDSLKKKVLEFVSSIRYSNDGYIFIIDKKQKVLAHINTELINNYLPKKDNQKNITQRIVDAAKQDESFMKYKTIYHNQTRDKVEKTSYIKNFDQWSWIIGSGFYRDKLDVSIAKKKAELDEYQKEYLLNVFIIITAITSVLVAISMYFSSILRKRFIEYRSKIYEEMERNREKDNLLAQQSKMAAMGEMIGNIAHQWRQPLSLISTSSSGLKLKHELNMLEPEDIVETANNITTTTQHLSKTIDDFRNFFKPNKESTNTTTSNLWEKTHNLIKDQYRTKNIQLITDIEHKDINLYESELIQVIINILNNARDEFEKKEQHENYIFIEVKENNEKLYIIIKDNAGGMPEHVLGRVFEPYFTTKHQSQGTGIGLYMSQEIIKKHMEGTIEAYNSEYVYNDKKFKGAKFSISINSY